MQIVDNIIKIIIEAGKLSLEYYSENITINEKKDKTIFSQADIDVEKLIINNLKELDIDAFIIGEESMETLNLSQKEKVFKKVLEKKYVWAVDPIDGTNNFVNGYG